jgi:hypothetical protein
MFWNSGPNFPFFLRESERDKSQWYEGKSKGKARLITNHEGPEGEYRCNSTLYLTSAIDGVGGQHHASSALPQGMTRYPLYSRLSGPQGRSGRVRKISLPSGFNLRTVQSIVSRYTDWVSPDYNEKEMTDEYCRAIKQEAGRLCCSR